MKRSNANKMILSESKMKCMFVTGKRLCKCIENDKLSTQVNGKQLGQVEFQKLLGVLIDEKCSLVDHISELWKRLSLWIAVLKTIRTSCSVDNLTKVLKLQKHAAHVILNADTRDNSVKLFSRLGWLPFYDEAKINKCPVGDCPQYMKSLFTRNSDIHHRRSRFGEWNLVCKIFNRETEGGRTF